MTDVQTRTCTEQHHAEPNRPGVVPTRRAVLTGAGAFGATCLLAACGTDSAGDTPAAEPPAGSPAAPAGDSAGGSGGDVLVAKADVPTGSAVIKGDYVITQPEEGTFKAFSKVCTHQGCDVTKIEDTSIICECHKSKFSIEDGSPTSGPAKSPLKEKQVKVDGDNIVAA